MARKINRVKVDLGSYPHYLIMGVKKVGKTTLFSDLVDYLYPNHPEKGILISCGDEDGYKGLDQLQYEEVLEWDKVEDSDGNRGLVQAFDEIISLRGTDEQIDLVCIDTLDEFVELAIGQVKEEHRSDKGKYPISMNEALGGYGAGQKRVTELMMEQIRRLNQAGLAVFILAHTKVKEQTDPLTQDPYEMITNNLDSRYYNPVANSAQMVVNIVMDRNIEGVTETKKKVKGKEETIVIAGRQTTMERNMYFRENPFVDAGGRFKGLPEKLPLSAENFMKAFKMGVEASQKTQMSNDEYNERLTEEQNKNIENGIKLHKKEIQQKKKDIAQEINIKLSSNPPKEVLTEVVKEIQELGLKSFDDESLKNVEIEQLQNILKLF